LDIFAYNWGTTSWDQIGLFQGANSSTDVVGTFSLLVAHTGTGANIGKVDLRGYQPSGLTSATLMLDQVFLSYAVVSQTVGYAQGRVWINTDAANTNTESYVDGVADNPVSTLTAAKTIADALGMKDFHVTPNSTITLAADINGYNMFGVGYTLNVGGYDVGDTHFIHSGQVNGTALAASGHVDFLDSIIQTMTVNESHFTNCSFAENTVTLGAVASDVKIINCRSVVAGASTPTLDFGTSAGIDHNVTIADWQNGMQIANFNANVTVADLLSISGTGQLIIAASCTGGTINLRGQWKITDNAGGAVTIVYDGVAQDVIDIIADTNELQGDWANGGRLDLIVDAILADTNELQSDDVPGLIAALNDVSTAEVLTQVNTALDTAIAELGVAAPTATPTMRTGLMLLYMALRNKTVVQTSGTDALEIHNDAGVKIASKLLTDTGTDYTEAEMS